MKKKKPQEIRERKVNIDRSPADDQELTGWTLEEIMDEFGGWTKREPQMSAEAEPPKPAAAEPQKQEPVPNAPETSEPIVQEPERAEPSAPVKAQISEPEKPEVEKDPVLEALPKKPKPPENLTGDTIRFTPVQAEKPPEKKPEVWVYKGEAPPGASEATPRALRQKARKQRQLERTRDRERRKELRRRELPDHVFSNAGAAKDFYAAPGSIRLRLALCALLTLVSAVLLAFTVEAVPGVSLASVQGLICVILLVILLVQALLSYDILLEGLRAILHLRFSVESLLLLTLLVVILDTVPAIVHGRIPFCSAVSLQLTVCLWSRRLLYLARFRSLKTVCEADAPVAVVRQEKAWHELDCIFRSEADPDGFAAQLELPDAGRRLMRVYAPVLALLSLALSVLVAIRTGESFLWAWAAILCAACPVGTAIAFARPFARLSGFLQRSGAAVAGWFGARVLSGEVGLATEDSDLFPASNVTLNGMKIYSSEPVPRIVSYATAVVETAGSGLVPLFEEMRREQNGRQFHVDAFRRYEGGGLGAEIAGDVVLMGSHGFMRLMKVQMPEQAKVKQAVYLSINGDLAAVFALTHAPASGVKASLFSAVHSKKLIPILATSDFMITPQFLKQRYKLPPDRVEFPTVEERARLAERKPRPNAKQGAVMAKDAFSTFVSVVTGARSLRSAAITALSVSIVGSLLGMLMLAFLTFIGAVGAASGWNLLIYTVLWLLPNVLISALFGRI